ncbi:hypothetical protein DFH09DRAFT_1273719 [Mycena vulgaris]|nr:hypothetical protein DFH09DRAFT_1273719 [Mycena vulgaris]
MARISIPSLISLHIVIWSDHAAPMLAEIVGLFDTPAVTDLTIDYAHGDQISVLFDSTSLPNVIFPALTSLSFVARGCRCEAEGPFSSLQPIPSPPLRLLPVLSSLTLINVCFTSYIIEQILGPTSQPWPLLKTVTVCPREDIDILPTVYNTLRTAIDSKRQREQAIPKFRLSPGLFCEDYWDKNGVDVEVFNHEEIVNALG